MYKNKYLKATYDKSLNVGYIYLSNKPVFSTLIDIRSMVNIDLDEDNNVKGIEILVGRFKNVPILKDDRPGSNKRPKKRNKNRD